MLCEATFSIQAANWLVTRQNSDAHDLYPLVRPMSFGCGEQCASESAPAIRRKHRQIGYVRELVWLLVYIFGIVPDLHCRVAGDVPVLLGYEYPTSVRGAHFDEVADVRFRD